MTRHQNKAESWTAIRTVFTCLLLTITALQGIIKYRNTSKLRTVYSEMSE